MTITMTTEAYAIQAIKAAVQLPVSPAVRQGGGDYICMATADTTPILEGDGKCLATASTLYVSIYTSKNPTKTRKAIVPALLEADFYISNISRAVWEEETQKYHVIIVCAREDDEEEEDDG